MNNYHETFEKTGRRWMTWGLVAIPCAGFALLMSSAKGPEEGQPAADRPKLSSTTPAPVFKTARSLDHAGPAEEALPARVESDRRSGQTREDPLCQLLASRPELANSLKTLLENQRSIAVLPREQMLALRGTPEDVIELVKLYHEAPGDELRDEIFSAACNLSNPESAELLLHLLQVSGEPDITTFAGMALARMVDSTLLGEIIQRYETASAPDEQARMLGIIYQIRSPSRVPALIDLAEQQPGGEVASALLQTLGMIGSPEAVGYLLDRLVSAGEPQEQEAYSEAISRVAEANSLPLLITTAAGETGSRAARMAAIRALENYAPEYVESLLGTLAATESDAEVRQAASQALENARQFSI
ncbi:MAG: HEAT repeat domain-containing protein [Verrucomicrobia bacterium]|nr:HEAT repeat domain-containing protein [Verrucomicrobiota bacterium]